MTSHIAAALHHAQETEATLYELFPFGLVYEILVKAPVQHGDAEEPGAVTAEGETGFRAALPQGG